MGRKWPSDDIPEPGTVLESGPYLFSIANIEEQFSRDAKKLMYNVELRVKEGDAEPGTPYYERFVIGTDDDPDAQEPETWKKQYGSKMLRKMMICAGVRVSKDIDKDIASAIDREVGAIVRKSVVKELDRDGKPNQRAGQEENRIAKFSAPGEIAVGGKPKPKPAAAAKPKPAPPVDDDDDDEDEDETPPPKKAKKKPAPPVDDDDEDDDD